MILWLTSVFGLWILFIAIARRFHPQLAAGIVIPLAWLAPVWTQWTLFEPNGDTIVGTGIDVKLGTTIAVLVSYLFSKRSTYPVRLVPCDYAMIGLVLVHGMCDFYYQGLQPIVLGRIYAEWWAPYVVGRIAFQYRADISRFWPVIAGVAIVLACLSALEMGLGTSLYEELCGARPKEGRPSVAMRWGLRRAYGPTLNPIYFGSLQLLLFAWTLYAALRAINYQASFAWVLAPVFSCVGIICCGSRAPMLGMAIVIPALLYFRYPQFRWGLLSLAMVGSLILVSQREAVIQTLEHWSGEDEHYRAYGQLDVGEGQSKQYSTTRYRVLLLDVYKIAFKRAGLLGFGTEAVTGFPIQVPVGPQEVETLHKMKMIDNTYLLITLRFGYLGLFFFTLAACLSVYQLMALSIPLRTENIGLLVASLGSCLLAIMPVLFTVWMPQDYGFVLLWSWGASSGMYLAHFSGKFNDGPPHESSDE